MAIIKNATLKLKCFKRDIQYLEPIILMQEYKEHPDVEVIEVSFVDNDDEQIQYYIRDISTDLYEAGEHCFVYIPNR